LESSKREIIHESCGKGLSIVNSAGSDYVDGLAIEGRLPSLAQSNDFGDKDGCRDTEI